MTGLFGGNSKLEVGFESSYTYPTSHSLSLLHARGLGCDLPTPYSAHGIRKAWQLCGTPNTASCTAL